MRIQHTQVSVQVPATSANLGPGFDTMGLALDLCDEIVLLSHGELEAVERAHLGQADFKAKILAALREL